MLICPLWNWLLWITLQAQFCHESPDSFVRCQFARKRGRKLSCIDKFLWCASIQWCYNWLITVSLHMQAGQRISASDSPRLERNLHNMVLSSLTRGVHLSVTWMRPRWWSTIRAWTDFSDVNRIKIFLHFELRGAFCVQYLYNYESKWMSLLTLMSFSVHCRWCSAKPGFKTEVVRPIELISHHIIFL